MFVQPQIFCCDCACLHWEYVTIKKLTDFTKEWIWPNENWYLTWGCHVYDFEVYRERVVFHIAHEKGIIIQSFETQLIWFE
jgi:hypothetical protein